MKTPNQRFKVRIIGETNNRQSKQEIQNILFAIEDYMGINKNNKDLINKL